MTDCFFIVKQREKGHIHITQRPTDSFGCSVWCSVWCSVGGSVGPTPTPSEHLCTKELQTTGGSVGVKKTNYPNDPNIMAFTRLVEAIFSVYLASY